ncbi:hypothetical protein DFQ26_003611 [Actinomortierella ambigua]|nr:hypothetical protein DFQ26_003611 [Actinomortierella ambigua]
MAATVAVSHAESFLGQVLALSLADELHKRDKNDGEAAELFPGDDDPVKQQVVCLVRDPKHVPLLDEHPRCRVVSIAYDNRSTIELALEGISTVVLVPESEENQVELAKILISAMVAKNVLRCTLISFIGTDASEKKHLQRYKQVEDLVKHHIQHWTVMRQDFVLQSLLYWVTMAKEQGRIAMSINENSIFAPVDIHDIALAINTIVLPRRGKHKDDDNEGDDDDNDDVDAHDGQIYTATGPMVVTGPILAMQLSDALDSDNPISVVPSSDDENSGLESFIDRSSAIDQPTPTALPVSFSKSKIEFATIEREVLYQYLRSLSKSPEDTLGTVLDTPKPLATNPSKGADEGRGAIDNIVHRIYRMFLGDSHSSHYTMPRLPISRSAVSVTPIRGSDGSESDDGSSHCSSCPDGDGHGHVDEGKEPELDAPNDTEINTLLELLDYIREGRATFISGDIEKITGKKGQKPKTFFDRHGKEFGRDSL